jgi:ribosomal protein S18 acetylase RimI-like enzyme
MTTTLVRTRHATPHDVPAVTALHDRCTPATLRQRFHAPTTRVPERLVAQLVTPRRGWSMVAEQCDQVVGLGVVGEVSPQQLEVGLLVEDAHQGTGIGSRLLRDLARDAVVHGYDSLVCLVQPNNDTVPRTVQRAGLHGEATLVDGLVTIVMPLPARDTALERPA